MTNKRAISSSIKALVSFAYLVLLLVLNTAQAVELIVQQGNLKPSTNIHKVYAAGPPAAVLIYSLAPNKLLGWPSSMHADSLAFIHPEQKKLPAIGRLAGRGSTISLETLLLLAPDVIVDVGSAGATQRSAAANITQQMGIATLQVEGLLLNTPDQLRQVGDKLGVSERAEQLAVYAEHVLAHAQQRKTLSAQPVKVYFARGYDGLETGLAGSIHSEVIELVGAKNVASVEGRSGLGRVSLEQLLVWQPEYILTQDPEFVTWVKTAKEWQALQAVRTNHVYLIPRTPFGWLDAPPGVNRLLGVIWLSALLDGTLEEPETLEKIYTFYRLFYRTPESVLKQVDLQLF